jgi:NADH dehydrogenase
VVIHIYYIIGFANKLLVLIQWVFSYLTFKRSARLITNEKSFVLIEPKFVPSPGREAEAIALKEQSSPN